MYVIAHLATYLLGHTDKSQVDVEMRQGAELYAHLKQLLKLYMRQRDKVMMLEMIEEVTDIFDSDG
jgi:hypothetical protein